MDICFKLSDHFLSPVYIIEVKNDYDFKELEEAVSNIIDLYESRGSSIIEYLDTHANLVGLSGEFDEDNLYYDYLVTIDRKTFTIEPREDNNFIISFEEEGESLNKDLISFIDKVFNDSMYINNRFKRYKHIPSVDSVEVVYSHFLYYFKKKHVSVKTFQEGNAYIITTKTDRGKTYKFIILPRLVSEKSFVRNGNLYVSKVSDYETTIAYRIVSTID